MATGWRLSATPQTHFVIRNSWGTDFCDQGFVLCSNAYVQSAVCEAYGVVV